MDQRTIRKILDKLLAGEWAETRVQGYRYYVEYSKEEDVILMFPVAEAKWHQTDLTARSDMQPDDYRYTHGGSVFVEVQNATWQIEEAYRKFLVGKQ